MMKDTHITFQTTIPEEIYAALKTRGLYREQLATDARLALAVHYFENHALSLGQAADLAGLDRWDFIDLLGGRGISVVDLNEEEFADELSSVDDLTQQLTGS